jgi:hypothetical protein
MNLLLGILVVALIAMVAALFAGALVRARKSNGVPLVGLANIAEGTHAGGKLTKLTDVALTIRFLLVKIGSDIDHIAINTAADIPLGVCTDEAAGAEENVNVEVWGCSHGTKKVVASGAITAGAFVVGDAAGKVRTLPGTTGTYYIIGRALNAAAADLDIVEIDPIPLTQRVVP